MIRRTIGLRRTWKGLLLISLFFMNYTLLAQQGSSDFFHRKPIEVKVKAKDTTQTKAYPMAVGISAGTQAFIAADFAINLSSKLNARVAYHQLTYTFQENTFDFNGAELRLNAKFQQNNLSIFGEYMLLNRLRLVAGLAYAPDNALNFNSMLADSIQVFDFTASPEEIGFIGGTIQLGNKVAPYFGLAFGSAVPQKRVGLSADLGAYYKGSPMVDLVATNVLRNNVNNEQIIEDAIGFARWWPVFSLRLAVRIN